MPEYDNFHDLHREPFPRAVIAKKDSAQTINNVTTTVIIYNDEILDVDAQYNNATGTFTALRNGVYQVTASILYASTNTLACGEHVHLVALVAGGTVYYLDFNDQWACGATLIYPHLHGTALVRVTAGQTVQVATRQASGGNLPLFVADDRYNYLNILRVAPYNP